MSALDPPSPHLHLQEVVDNLPALVAYWDRELRNQLANQAYLSYFGVTPEQIRGRHISAVLGDELYRRNRPYIEAALAGRPQSFEREIATRDGRRMTYARYIPDLAGEVRGFYVLVTDITEVRAAEALRAQAERRFTTLFLAAPTATMVLDGAGRITAVNPAGAALLGRDIDTLLGMTDLELTYPDDVAESRARMRGLWEGRLSRYTIEKRYVHRDGHSIWTETAGTLIAGADGGGRQVLKQIQDVTARRRHLQELEHLADHDALTGLLNRRGLFRELERQAAHARRYETGGVLLVIDLDRFKEVNDTLGHAAGDAVLARVAGLIRSRTRETDSVARLGGDEFAVILPMADRSTGRTVAEQIGTLLNLETACGREGCPPVTASIGLAEFTAQDSAEDVLAAADLAMYAVKDAARGRPASRAAVSRPPR